MKNDVIRFSDTRCSYKCPYYLDGAILSLCTKYNRPLKYGGSIPPLLTDECKNSILEDANQKKPD